MNERLKELLKQSELQPYYDAQEKHIEQFAELIIRECISEVVDRHSEYFATQALKWQMGCRIKEHFGVE
jgi:hypothetical protein